MASEGTSSVQAGEDIAADSRIRSGPLVLAVEEANTHRPWVTSLIPHNPPLTIPICRSRARPPRSPTAITPSVLRKIYKLRTLASPNPPPTNRCLPPTDHHRPVHSPPPPSSALLSRRRNRLLLSPNPRYRPSSMLLHLVSRRHNRATSGTAETCHVTCPRSRHLRDHAVAIIDSINNSINSNVLSPRHRGYAWSRRP